MAAKIYEIIPYDVVALKWERDNWDEVVEFLKAHNTEAKRVSKYCKKTLEFLGGIHSTTWYNENIDVEGRYAFYAYRPEDDSHDEYEEFTKLGDYLVVGKDGLIYVKQSYSFEHMFREKKNV